MSDLLKEEKKTRIVLVPHNTARAWSWVVPNVFFRVCVGILITIFVGIAVFGWEYTQKVVNEQKLARLKLQNEYLKDKIRHYSQNVALLQHQMERYRKFDTDIRIISDLEMLDADVANVGVGGAPEVYPKIEEIRKLDPESAKLIENIKIKLDELERKSRFQKESFEDIVISLTNQQDFWNHTPSILPCKTGLIGSGFGMRRDPITGKYRMHEGQDIRAKKGTPIYATANGTVIFAGRKAGYGLTVDIDHGYGIQTRYAHCSLLKVKKGDSVIRGQEIALVGSTGRSTGAHLHYEIRVGVNKVNPLKYILPDSMTR